jgi:hypothetical protein
MGEGFSVDPEALRAAAGRLDEHAGEVASHGEVLGVQTAGSVGRGAIGEVVESAVRRGIRIVAHDISRAVEKFYADAAAVMRRAAAETERTDAEAKSAFEDLARGRDREVGTDWPALTKERELPRGLDPTPETIRHGTVRMEEHPEYGRLTSEMEAAGYPLEEGDPPPCVERVQFVDQSGNVLRVEQRLVVQPGMRFLDLEHEAGHVHQFRERFSGDQPFTNRYVERPGRPPRRSSDESGLLSIKQNAIAEFHNRLQEYNRLAERGVAPDVLAEHAQEMVVWFKRYRGAVLNWQGGPTKLTPWASHHFPDIGSLLRRYRELGGTLTIEMR